MLVVDQYMYLPGCCTFCNSSNLPTIDTGFDLDWPNSPDDPNPSANRRLYVCADCAINFADMVKSARNIELKPAGTLGAMQQTMDDLAKHNVELSMRLAELEQAIVVFKDVNRLAPVESMPVPVEDLKEFKVAPPKAIK